MPICGGGAGVRSGLDALDVFDELKAGFWFGLDLLVRRLRREPEACELCQQGIQIRAQRFPCCVTIHPEAAR